MFVIPAVKMVNMSITARITHMTMIWVITTVLVFLAIKVVNTILNVSMVMVIIITV